MESSRTVDLGTPVHFLDLEGDPETPWVLVHGLGGSHCNWLPALDGLRPRGRLLVIDLAGFGRTPPGTEGASFSRNLRLLERFVAEVAGRPAVLVGNSMGGALSLALAAQRPDLTRGLVLVDPACPLPFGAPFEPRVLAGVVALAIPGLGERTLAQRRARFGTDRAVRELLRLCVHDFARIDPDVFEHHCALARERAGFPWADRAFGEAARSLVYELLRARSYYRRARSVTAPTLLVHGAHDRLVPRASAEVLAKKCPSWAFHVWEHLGHVPQLEDPAAFLDVVTPWAQALRALN